MRVHIVAICAFAMSTGGVATRQVLDRPGRAPDVRSCYLAGVTRPVRCVTIRVPVDWGDPGGDSLDVSAVVVPAIGRALPDPLFVLPGGPGQGASTYGRLVGTAFAEIRKNRDVVLVDPRGTGLSTPFPCDFGGDADGPATPADVVDIGRRCAAEAPVDPRHLTAAEIVEDIEALRVRLGYGVVNVWGGSFGTRLAQYYLKAHGGVVRTAIFDAAGPLGSVLLRTAPLDAQAALEEIFARCALDAACDDRFAGGLASFEEILRSFDNPRTLAAPDPRTAIAAGRLYDRRTVAEIVRGALYAPQYAVQLPYAVERLGQGDPRPALALQLETEGWSTSTMQLGAMLSVMCSEEAAPARSSTSDPGTASTVFGDDYAQVFFQLCEAWPARTLPPSFLEPLAGSPTPALILSGAVDPVAPPRRGDALAASFVRAIHLVVRNGGHVNSARGCAPRLLADFLDAPDASVDGSCLDDVAWPPFTLSAQGPVPQP